MKYIYTLFSLLLLSGCADFLDRDPLAEGSESSFWKTEKDAETALNALYPLLPGVRDFWRDCNSDNSVMTNAWGEAGIGYIAQGIHNSSTGYLKEEWVYDDIHRVLYFLDKLKDFDFSESRKERFEGEARFILGLQYYRLTRHWGDVPLIKEKPINLEEAALPRSPKQEVLDYAIENINKAIEFLPVSYEGGDIGRITKGAALTLKADLYADMASYKQFHNNSDASELWKIAAKAAEDVIDLNIYSLENDFSLMFLEKGNNANSEVILAHQYKEDERTHMTAVLAAPGGGIGLTGSGWGAFGPTRQLIDSYEMVDGKSIKESSLYDENDPWENRDTRLKKTFILPNTIDYLFSDGTYRPFEPHGIIGNESAGKTGFMYMKYNDLNHPKPYSSWVNWSIYRYAEVLLLSAEALNEIDPSNPDIINRVNLVRNRSGLPNSSITIGDKENMRNAIRVERQHEFVAEHKRYFDILRWKIAEIVLNEPGYGMNLDADTPTGDYSVEQILGEKRIFSQQMYLWPIPDNAMDNNPNLTQNKGW